MATGIENSHLVHRQLVSNGTDFDTLTSRAGVDLHYYGTSISSMINRPSDRVSAHPFILDVVNDASYSIQILRVYGANYGVYTYTRGQYYVAAGQPYAWTPWVLIGGVNKNGSSNGVNYRKCGQTVTVSYLQNGTRTETTGAWITIATLPGEYRPDDTLTFAVSDNWQGNKVLSGRIDANGQVQVFFFAGIALQPAFTITYVTTAD